MNVSLRKNKTCYIVVTCHPVFCYQYGLPWLHSTSYSR